MCSGIVALSSQTNNARTKLRCRNHAEETQTLTRRRDTTRSQTLDTQRWKDQGFRTVRALPHCSERQ